MLPFGVLVFVRVLVIVGVLVRVAVGVLVKVGIMVGVLVIVGVLAGVLVRKGVLVRVGVTVGQTGCMNESCKPALRPPVLHSNCVLCGPVPFCTPTVALMPPWAIVP